MSYQIGYVIQETDEVICDRCSQYQMQKMRLFQDNGDKDLACDLCGQTIGSELQ